MIKKLIFLLILLSQISYSLSDYKNFEDSYVQIRCGKLKDDFFMIKYDFETEKVYVGLNSLFYFLEIYTLDIDLENMKVQGSLGEKNINVKFSKDEAFIMENSLYVELETIEKKLNFKSVKFDFSLLSLNLVSNFTLPYEMREKSKIERLRLEQEENNGEKINFIMPDRAFSPGFLKLNWNKYDLQEKDYNLRYEYGNQFLYGSLYLSGEFYPENKIEYGNLTYSDFWQGNDLVLGSFSMITPHFINLGSEVIGISFRDENTYMTRDGGETIVKGEAENAQIVELYRENVLIDYIYPTSKYFEFRILDGILNSDYTLKIYYNDGRIEEKKVYSLTDMDILQKGKNRISVQLGKNSDNGKPQGLSHIYYGLTDNLTVGLGVMELVSVNDRKYRILENDIIFNTRHKNFPTIITYRNFYENEEKQNNYNLIVEQKLKSYTLRYLQEKYSSYVYEEYDLKEYNSISLGKTFENNSFEIGVNDKKYFNEENEYESKNIYLAWYTSILSPISFSLKMERDLYRGNDYNVFYPSISYSGKFSIIVDGEIGKERNDESYTQNYTIRLNKRDLEILKDKLYLDIGLFTKYSNINEKFRYGIAFELKWDNFIHMEFSSNTNISEEGKRSTINGISTSKLINLEKPLAKINNTSAVTNSWVYGKVYLDKNSNEIYDEDDVALENVEVLINSQGFLTNESGNYIAIGISGDEVFTLDINRKTIDPSYKNSMGKLRIKSKKSSTVKIDIPIQPISILSGNIILSEDFTEKQFIQQLSMITVFLEKDGEIIAETDPEFDGMYFFEDVLPGQYTIRFNYLGYENIDFSNKTLDITIKNNEEGDYFDGLDTEMIKGEEN